jgi:hypothetical protein
MSPMCSMSSCPQVTLLMAHYAEQVDAGLRGQSGQKQEL